MKHKATLLKGGTSVWVECSCGWTSQGFNSESAAIRSWSVHLNEHLEDQ